MFSLNNQHVKYFVFIFFLLTAGQAGNGQEISDIFLNQALNVRVESVQMELLDQLMLESGLVFPVHAKPITHREWRTYVTAALQNKTVQISPRLRAKLEQYIPNYRYRSAWHSEMFSRIGFETIQRSDDAVPYFNRYEDRLPIARFSYQASRDTAFGFSIQMRIENFWPVYTTTNNRTNLPEDIRRDLDFRVFHRAYFSYQTPRMTFQFGRDKMFWGVGEQASTFLSHNVPYFDYIKFVLWFDVLKFSMAYISLTDYEPQGLVKTQPQIGLLDKPERNMMLQRVEWNLFPSLSIGTSYMKIIFGRLPKLGDVNPFIWQHNLFKEYQNSLMSFDAVWGILPGIQWYGEITSDEIQSSGDAKYDDPGGKTTLAYQTGIKTMFFGFKTVVEYVVIAPYMYNFPIFEGRAIDLDGVDYSPTTVRDVIARPLGHWLPADSKNIYASIEKEIFDDIFVKVIAERREKGAVNLLDPYPAPTVVVPDSPTGIVQTTDLIGLYNKFRTRLWEIRLSATHYSINNVNNIANVRKDGIEAKASVSFRLF